jgi:hypothetical protein
LWHIEWELKKGLLKIEDEYEAKVIEKANKFFDKLTKMEARASGNRRLVRKIDARVLAAQQSDALKEIEMDSGLRARTEKRIRENLRKELTKIDREEDRKEYRAKVLLDRRIRALAIKATEDEFKRAENTLIENARRAKEEVERLGLAGKEKSDRLERIETNFQAGIFKIQKEAREKREKDAADEEKAKLKIWVTVHREMEKVAKKRREEAEALLEAETQARFDMADEWLKDSKITQEEYVAIMEAAEDAGLLATEDAIEKKMAATGRWFEQLNYGLDRARIAVTTWGETMIAVGKQLVGLISDNMADAFVDFIDGTKSAGEAFEDFAKDTINWLIRMILRQHIFNTLMGLMGKGIGATKIPAAPAPEAYPHGTAYLHQGGWINEPVTGVGQRSGKVYRIAERVPEYVETGERRSATIGKGTIADGINKIYSLSLSTDLVEGLKDIATALRELLIPTPEPTIKILESEKPQIIVPETDGLAGLVKTMVGKLGELVSSLGSLMPSPSVEAVFSPEEPPDMVKVLADKLGDIATSLNSVFVPPSSIPASEVSVETGPTIEAPAEGGEATAPGGGGTIALQHGGWVNEPVTGVGQKSGKFYKIAEKRPEYVSSSPQAAGGPTNVKIVLENKSGTALKATQGRTQFDGRELIVVTVLDAYNRNTLGMRDVMGNG